MRHTDREHNYWLVTLDNTPPQMTATAQLSTTVVLSRLKQGPPSFCIVINIHLWDLFQMMGQVLTLTRRSGLVKIVSLAAECVSVAGLCFFWILAFCHTHPLPSTHTLFFSPVLGTDHPLTHSTSSASQLFKSLSLYSAPLLPFPSTPHPPPVRPPTPESD